MLKEQAKRRKKKKLRTEIVATTSLQVLLKKVWENIPIRLDPPPPSIGYFKHFWVSESFEKFWPSLSDQIQTKGLFWHIYINKNDYGWISSGNESPSVAKLSVAFPYLFYFPPRGHPHQWPPRGNSIPILTNQRPRNLLHNRQAGRTAEYGLYSEVALAKNKIQ